eukprot:g13786.t1
MIASGNLCQRLIFRRLVQITVTRRITTNPEATAVTASHPESRCQKSQATTVDRGARSAVSAIQRFLSAAMNARQGARTDLGETEQAEASRQFFLAVSHCSTTGGSSCSADMKILGSADRIIAPGVDVLPQVGLDTDTSTKYPDDISGWRLTQQLGALFNQAAGMHKQPESQAEPVSHVDRRETGWSASSRRPAPEMKRSNRLPAPQELAEGEGADVEERSAAAPYDSPPTTTTRTVRITILDLHCNEWTRKAVSQEVTRLYRLSRRLKRAATVSVERRREEERLIQRCDLDALRSFSLDFEYQIHYCAVYTSDTFPDDLPHRASRSRTLNSLFKFRFLRCDVANEGLQKCHELLIRGQQAELLEHSSGAGGSPAHPHQDQQLQHQEKELKSRKRNHKKEKLQEVQPNQQKEHAALGSVLMESLMIRNYAKHVCELTARGEVPAWLTEQPDWLPLNLAPALTPVSVLCKQAEAHILENVHKWFCFPPETFATYLQHFCGFVYPGALTRGARLQALRKGKFCDFCGNSLVYLEKQDFEEKETVVKANPNCAGCGCSFYDGSELVQKTSSMVVV